MESLFEVNGLMFWTEREIRLRRQFAEHFSKTLYDILLETNPAWRFIEIEAPLLTPRKHINSNYTNQDVWVQEQPEGEELVLRPETTPGSYVAAGHLLTHHTGIKPPFVVWQSGKSFRREADQVTKNMRLKEFYQQEFQCIYAADTLNDYLTAILIPVQNMLAEVVGYPARIVASDRLPSYSEVTMDVEVDNGDKWMEICSISKRLDFPYKARFNTKKGLVEKDLLVLEVAIGLDRCVYNFQKRSGILQSA
jgi:glycyl-tRNA synthetase